MPQDRPPNPSGQRYCRLWLRESEPFAYRGLERCCLRRIGVSEGFQEFKKGGPCRRGQRTETVPGGFGLSPMGAERLFEGRSAAIVKEFLRKPQTHERLGAELGGSR